MSPAASNLVSEPYPESKTLWIPALGCLVWVWVCAHFSWPWYGWALGLFLCLLLTAARARRATIDYSERRVYEHSRFLSRYSRLVGEFSLSDFEAVVYRQNQNEGGDTTSVGLRHRSGRCIWFRTFPGGDRGRGRPAEEFAWRLSCDTGIPLDERLN